MSEQTKWEKTKRYSKRGFDKAWHTLDKLGAPVNRLSNKLGSEAFWPTTLDKESDKAARILRSFCKDGFYAEPSPEDRSVDIEAPQGKQRVLKKIPAEVIKQAKGLAIFTTMRSGLWLGGAGGSGIIVARQKETGEWSPPSGIMLHTAAVGFLVGVDIYDCVAVINTYEALEAFKSIRCTLGGEVSVVAGPVGLGGMLDSEVHKRRAPIWTYLKSRGFYAGVQIDGTVLIERSDENERFYNQRIPVSDILAGKVRHPPHSIRPLMQTIKAAQGDTDIDEELLPPPGETPGDIELEVADTFGVPALDDPDPYGVKALEREGIIIKEAGTKSVPSIDTFEFRPSPSSPVFTHRSRYSTDASSRRTSWRTSIQSAVSVDKGTQTDGLPMPDATSTTSSSSRSLRDITSTLNAPTIEMVDVSTHESITPTQTHQTQTNGLSSPRASITLHDKTNPDQPSPTSPSFARARLVTIPKRVPPQLPPRNPGRTVISPPLSPPPSTENNSDAGQQSPLSSVHEYDDDVEVLDVFDGPKKEKDESTASEPWSTGTQPEKDEFHSIPSSPKLDEEELYSSDEPLSKISASVFDG